MNDARVIEELGIHGITIAPALNDTANSNRITVEFWQEVRTPFAFDTADRAKATGQLVGKHGYYCGKMSHRFAVVSIQDAWPEIQRRARAYQEMESQLAKESESTYMEGKHERY